MKHTWKVHYTADEAPTLCGVHHYTEKERLVITEDSEAVTCGNCRRKIVFMKAKPPTDRRIKPQGLI